MCIFQKVKIRPGMTGSIPRKTLYMAENPDVKSEITKKCKIYLWDGEAWFEECIRKEQEYWKKKWAHWEKRAGKK